MDPVADFHRKILLNKNYEEVCNLEIYVNKSIVISYE